MDTNFTMDVNFIVNLTGLITVPYLLKEYNEEHLNIVSSCHSHLLFYSILEYCIVHDEIQMSIKVESII